jgi:hypothetical protein
MNSRWPTLGDWSLFLFVVLLFLIALNTCGCASGSKLPEDEGDLDIVIVKEPVPCIVVIALLDDPDLPPYPTHPGHDADEAEMKAWGLKIGEVTRQRDAIWRARDKAWAEKVSTNNSGLPLCSDVSIQ